MVASNVVSIFIAYVSLIIVTNGQASPPGIIQLDGFSFPKIVDGSHNIVVKFDEKQSYGSGEEWDSLGYELVDKPNIVMASVELNLNGGEDDYDMYGYGGMGEDQSEETGIEELFEQYGITPEMLPTYRLFLKNDDPLKPKTYDEASAGNLVQWIQSNGVYLGLEGCLKEFDELISDFIQYENNEKKRDEIGKKGKQLMDAYSETEDKYKSAKYYIKVMAKIVNNSNAWVEKEMERLAKILMSGNIRKEKQQWFKKRLNILSAFAMVINPEEKQEL